MMTPLIRSTCPFPRGMPVAIVMCSIPSLSQYSLKMDEVNAEPLSLMIRLGFPKTAHWVVSFEMTSAAFVVFVG